ncbi:hypothetical protein MBOVJF4428_00293 [Mycoplasmopsis agalactiae]|uniref:Uncharacterized protein n=1 Tax=Mycoplasmopsis agalactiae (strain NCTC 10123 / CIP 59.7 / PG2) TaxID=347257 RepID=A5IYC6_MYCAP|nr:hypothetical protein [Mycoplasmopsis agalactiae]MCE6057100.1 hypothetical protein [Mycoplasmopsis agalactiae]MCE6078887.1 hypothetical protein [Mycoplasmopsis agalactiae]MCE6095272.1 hypothetical protein [Mycoplasmopsis agalactiae]MCE6114527.1 hypothetical protein [Mycoplasmopsis agalactiae]NLS34363.1 hypothetical protein [Mycoplasmopsis agalactiae]
MNSNIIMFGKIYKVRNNKNNLPIAINKNENTIGTIKNYKLNRPYVVFYSNDKVYFLPVKTIRNSNKKSTNVDKKNIIIPNINIYGNEAPIGNAINCSVINVMDRELFESLFEKDSKWNNVDLDNEIYYEVMTKLLALVHSNNVKFSQVIGFTKTKTEFIKDKKMNQQIKDDALNFINTYTKLLYTPIYFIDKELSKLPDIYLELRKHFIFLSGLEEDEVNNAIKKPSKTKRQRESKKQAALLDNHQKQEAKDN